MKKNFDVIVAGAGPVGLWLACELKLAGVDVAVIERRRERTVQSRALTIHGRTLEVFALRGLAGRFLRSGKHIPSGHYAALDTRLDFSPFDTRFPYTLFLPQAVTEERLEERAQELGVVVARGVEVNAVADMGDHVDISTGCGDFSAAYLVGADGARSVVRTGADIAFDGLEAGHSLMLGDVVLASPPASPVVSKTNEHGTVMIAPLGDGKHHRIVLVDPQRTHVPRFEPVTLEELAAPAARIAGEDFEPHDPIWMSRFTDETRLASTYRKGRILLAGDAAHIHAPMGGQGMNVGLQDAMNLGWKLAAVVKGEAPTALLDTYTEERRSVGQTLYANTLSQVGLVTRFDPATLALRDTLADLLTMPAVNRRLAGEISGFDVHYASPSAEAVPPGKLHAGARVPDIDLTIDGVATTLYSSMVDGKWLHLVLDTSMSTTGPDWLPKSSIRTAEARSVEHGAFQGVRALLVRPDGYVHSIID